MPLPTPPKKPVPAPEPSSGPPKHLILLVVGLVAGFLVGYGAGRISTGTPINPLAKGGFDQGYQAAEQKLIESGLIPSDIAAETTSLIGTVKEVSDNKIVLTTALTHPNPLSKVEIPTERTITVTDSTKLVRRVEKKPEALDAEFRKFEAALEAGEEIDHPPEPYKLEVFVLSDLKPDTLVQITADHDIFFENAFDASEISVIQLPLEEPTIEDVSELIEE